MSDNMLRPELIIIAGPNGSGKTSVTRKFLHHEWAEGTIYINPDEVAKDKFGIPEDGGYTEFARKRLLLEDGVTEI